MNKDELSNEVVASRGSSPPPNGWQGAIARFFKFEEFQTNFRTEVLAGVTTFMTMAYILAVNPGILSNAIFLEQPQDLFGELAIATAISSAIALAKRGVSLALTCQFATLMMGLTANYPFALAPGMGLNAFFAFSVVLALKIDWRVALTAVLIEGLIFIALTLSNIRSQIIRAIPECLKQATAAGIGLFIAYIGKARRSENGGCRDYCGEPRHENRLGKLATAANTGSELTSQRFAIAGILITFAFVARRVKGALLWGILATALLEWILRIVPPPSGIIALPQWPGDLLGQAFQGLSQINQTNIWNLIAVTFVFLFIDLFDTIGTLAGVGTQAGYIDENGELPRASEALMADAVGTTVGAILGTSTVTTYIESAAGVSEGGRTGFTAVVVAALFTLSIFFIPLLAAIPAFATAPALLVVGVLMAGNVRLIRWEDPAESIPSFLTILLMPLTYSIAEGLSIGFITYPLLKTFQGKAHEISLAVWILAGVFVLRFIFMAVSAT